MHGVHWHVGKGCEVYLLSMANARLETAHIVGVIALIVAKADGVSQHAQIFPGV